MTNNALIVESKYEESKDSTLPATSEESVRKVLATIFRLKSYVHYANFVELIIEPEIESLKTRLENESDPSEVRRLQGQIKGLKKFKELPEIEKNYKSKLTRIQNGRKHKE